MVHLIVILSRSSKSEIWGVRRRSIWSSVTPSIDTHNRGDCQPFQKFASFLCQILTEDWKLTLYFGKAVASMAKALHFSPASGRKTETPHSSKRDQPTTNITRARRHRIHSFIWINRRSQIPWITTQQEDRGSSITNKFCEFGANPLINIEKNKLTGWECEEIGETSFTR